MRPDTSEPYELHQTLFLEQESGYETTEGHGALDLDNDDQEEDSSIVWADERLDEDSMSDSGK